MRLLYFEEAVVKVTADRGDHGHKYAVLSHTWGQDEEEVTFQEIRKGRGREKKGYENLLFCGEQARKDGFTHFWVDTCCIDKSSQTELAEAIISMFRWYQNAAKCYVYLSDVTGIKHGPVSINQYESQWQTEFEKSRWFTRGWTLQELLAPCEVLFYSHDYQYLGNRSSLTGVISSITGIPVSALLGMDLSEFSVRQRLLWANKRQTKRSEDRVYCLIGLFNVSMCVRYGETLEHALSRLINTLMQDHGHEVDDLNDMISLEEIPNLHDTDSLELQGTEESLVKISRRLLQSTKLSLKQKQNKISPTEIITQDVRERLLQSLAFPEMNSRINQIHDNEPGTFEWIYNDYNMNWRYRTWDSFGSWLSTGQGIFWIQGKAGSGKSTLMKFLWDNQKTNDILIERSVNKDICILKYSFWLSGTPQQRSVDGCYRNLLHQILQKNDTLPQDFLAKFPEMASKKYAGDWSVADLGKVILFLMQRSFTVSSICVFIDGLDELEARENYPNFVQFLRQLDSITSVKVCVSSRPESFWCNQFANVSQLRLQDLVEDDIRKFVEHRLEEAGYEDLVHLSKEKFISTVCEKAQGVFLWVHLALRSVMYALDGQASSSEVMDIIETMPSEIAGLYESMLKRQGVSTTQNRREVALYLKMCLSDAFGVISEYAIVRLELDRARHSKRISNRDSLLHTAQTLRIRIPHISAGLIVCHDQQSWLKSYGLDELNVSVSFFHRTVKDFLTDIAAGQALLQNCEISDDQLLQTLLWGYLNYARATHPTNLRQHLQHGMILVAKLKSTDIFKFSTKAIIGAIENLDSEFVPTTSPRKSLTSCVINDSGLSHYQIFSRPPSRSRCSDVLGPWSFNTCHMQHCVDIVGLSLSAGLTEYVDNMLTTSTTAAAANRIGSIPASITMTSSYKDYLFLCAIRGAITSCTDSALSLLNAGADPFAEIYLPTWRPRRYCAAAKIVSILRKACLARFCAGANVLSALSPIWSVLIIKIIDLQSNNLMFVGLTHDNECSTRLNLIPKPITYEENSEHIAASKHSIEHFQVIFQTPIIYQLQHWLQLHESGSMDWNPLHQGEIGEMWLLYSFDEPAPFHRDRRTSWAAIEMREKEMQHVIRASEAVPNWKMQDINIFDIPSIQKLTAETPQVNIIKNGRRWMDSDTFLLKTGYMVETSDSRVFKSTFIRSIPVRTALESKEDS